MYGGRHVVCPPGVIRPAMDRMRESVFAILGDLTDTSFLDLFSGSGIIGIEAASRGASSVTFVEKDRRKIEVIKTNVVFISAEVRIICLPVERFLATNRHTFNAIFADPPYNYKEKGQLLDEVDRESTLAEGGSLLIHFPAEDPQPERTEGLLMYDRRKYGRSIVGFYTQGE